MARDTAAAAGSAWRTGARAGATFAWHTAQGLALAFLLGGGAFFFYLTRLGGPGMPVARAGGAGAVAALLLSPPTLVALLLILFIGVYAHIGIAYARGRALQRLVAAHGDAVAARAAAAIAGRIEAMPRTHGALQRTADWLSVDALSRQLVPVLGPGRVPRALARFLIGRLPLSDLLADWQAERAAQGASPAEGGPDAALRALIERRVAEALHDLAAPSRRPLLLAIAAHAVLLAVGLWLVGGPGN